MHISISFEEFLAEIKSPWQTMDQDMALAQRIISVHQDPSNTVPLFITTQQGTNEIQVSCPRWHQEVENALIDRYGQSRGRLIFNKVIMRLFQMARGLPIHALH